MSVHKFKLMPPTRFCERCGKQLGRGRMGYEEYARRRWCNRACMIDPKPKTQEEKIASKRAYNTAYRQAHLQDLKIDGLEWRKAHRAELREYARLYRIEHRGELSERRRATYLKHQSEISKQRRAAWAALPEKERKARSHKLYERYKYAYIAGRRNREARLRKAEGRHTHADILQIYNRQKGKCVYCKTRMGAKYTVDHIIPLILGGTNWPDNLQLLCRSCNSSKRGDRPEEYARRFGLLL